MNHPLPRQLLLTAGDADSVREQLGLSTGDPVQPLNVDELPLSSDLRQRFRDWATAFVALHRTGAPDDQLAMQWSEAGIGVASALADEWGPDVRFRYLAHSPVRGHPIAEPIAGLFEDVLVLPAVPIRSGWTAYQSTLTIEFGRDGDPPAPPAQPWLTADRTDATDDELRELRRRAVDPVVHSLLRPEELAGARIVVYQENGAPEINLWLEAVAEEMRHWLWHPGYSAHDSLDPVEIAAHLADSMEDWVCETRFGWGQHRLAKYEVPPAG